MTLWEPALGGIRAAKLGQPLSICSRFSNDKLSGSRLGGEVGLINYSDVGLEIRPPELHTLFRTHCSPVPRWMILPGDQAACLQNEDGNLVFLGCLFCVFSLCCLEVCSGGRGWIRRQEELGRSFCQNLTHIVTLRLMFIWVKELSF